MKKTISLKTNDIGIAKNLILDSSNERELNKTMQDEFFYLFFYNEINH